MSDNICESYCLHSTCENNGIECGGQCFESFWLEGYQNNEDKRICLNCSHELDNLKISVK
jgi:hypothetical protein